MQQPVRSVTRGLAETRNIRVCYQKWIRDIQRRFEKARYNSKCFPLAGQHSVKVEPIEAIPGNRSNRQQSAKKYETPCTTTGIRADPTPSKFPRAAQSRIFQWKTRYRPNDSSPDTFKLNNSAHLPCNRVYPRDRSLPRGQPPPLESQPK